MFSPSAENLSMPGRLEAAPRSRCAKSLLLAMCCDQSAAMLARSRSHCSGSRPLAWRSALSRANSSWVILSGTVLARLVAGAPVEDGAARRLVVLGGLVVAGPWVVVGALVVAAGLCLALVLAGDAVAAFPPGIVRPIRAFVWVASPVALARSAVEPSGRASAGIRNHASTSGSTIMAAMRRVASQGGSRRESLACCGAALRPELRSSRTVPASRSETVGRPQRGTAAPRRDPLLAAAPSGGNSGGVGSNSGVTLPNQPDQCQTHWSGGRESAAPVLADLAVDHLDGGADDGQEHGDADQDRGWWQRERELLAQPGDGQHAGERAHHRGQDGDAQRVEWPRQRPEHLEAGPGEGDGRGGARLLQRHARAAVREPVGEQGGPGRHQPGGCRA